MAPSNTKANYKTYEAQARMVRAIVAAHPDVKWNYKEIAACYGSDMTEHALNHRFRRLRAHAVIIQTGRTQGLDMKDMSTDENALPKTQEAIEKKNIAKYFGQSTADGIQFQFRQIKKDAEQLRKVEGEGGNVANCLSFGAGSLGPSTPSKPTPFRGVGSRSGATSKRSRTGTIKPIIKDESDDEEEDLNFSELDDTPSKRVKTTGARGRTPSRRAATQASVTIAAGAQVESSASPPEDIPTPSTEVVSSMAPVYSEPASIFGKVDHQHSAYDNKPASYTAASPFNSNGVDEYLGLGVGMYGSSKYSEFDGDDGHNAF